MTARLTPRLLLLTCAAILLLAPALASARIGGGIHYLRTLGDIKDSPDFDEDSIGFLGALDFDGNLIRLEADLEAIPDYGGSSEFMWQPQGYALIGGVIYGGAGIGIGYLGDYGWQDPFFALRAGVQFDLGSLDLDLFTSYRFQKAKDLETLQSDDLNSITFGALVWFGGY